MTIGKGSLKDWDDRHYQSIDDLPPEAWDAVNAKEIGKRNERTIIANIIGQLMAQGRHTTYIAKALQDAGFHR